jgi:hypothetical protein
MSILGGEPQLFVMSAGLLFLYGLICSSRKGDVKSHSKLIVTISILIVSAFLITMVQVGPTYNDYQLSIRLGGISYEEAAKHSLEPSMLKHLLIPLRFPFDFHTTTKSLQNFFPGNGEIPWLLTVYPGFLILPLAILAFFGHFSKKTLFWFFASIISIFFSLGDHTPIYKIFYQLSPSFRFPAKFMFIANYSLLVLSAYGIERLLSLFQRLKIHSSFFIISMSIILILDLSYANKNLNPIIESDLYQKHHEYLDPISNDPELFRVYIDPETDLFTSGDTSVLIEHLKWQSLLMPNLGILNNLYHVDGTTGMELRYQYLITEILKKPWSDKIRFLRMSNVKYIVSSKGLDKDPELKDQIERINPLLFRIKKYVPRAWIVGNLQPIEKGSVDELFKNSFDPFNSAITRGEIASKYNKPFFSNIENINYDRNNQIHIELTAETPSILVLSESSYPGWSVLVNGEKRECLWLNLLFQGVEVGSGNHKIDFIFQPKSFNSFLLISMISLAIFFLLWFYYLRFAKYASIKSLE